MSGNTPLSTKYNKALLSRDGTPKTNEKKTNKTKKGLIKPNSTIDLRDNDNIFNSAFTSASKSSTKLISKAISTTNLNACYTPTSLYKNIGSKPNKHSLTVTPKSAVKKFSSVHQHNTPECFSKVSLETPTRLARSNISKDMKSKEISEISNLKVAVRVRPMHSKECTTASVINVISVIGNEIKVLAGTTADSSAGVSHSFQYDNVFWSCNSKSNEYADQEIVFQGTAVPLVDKAFEGYNVCLFAYGQTGSGKSYSMMGIDADDDNIIGANSEVGIIPRFCQELFHRIDELKGKMLAEIEVSYFEIYNEKIHDLLAVSPTIINTPNNQYKRPALRVREHPIWGPYVVDLSTHPVDSHTALRNWLAVGNSQRATAATRMNDKSSRSHSIFNIVLNLSEMHSSGNETDQIQQTKRSKISLIDLSGSERISNTCASAERLREGVSINKSLLTLGKVISALAESKKTTGAFVPYRESVLTWLLRESLGGNSRTVMLATISPASCHLDETLATLRYACQARTIVNRVKVNEDPHDRQIRELRAEVERLQALQQDYDRQKRHSVTAPPRTIIIETSIDESKVEALRQQLNETEQELSRAQRSWLDRHQEILKQQENRLRQELEAEKEAAFLKIEEERFANEQKVTVKLANLEMEKFRYQCSKEMLDTEIQALEEEKLEPKFEYKPIKQSNLLDEIKRMMLHPSEESLHEIQLMVKEATQGCRDIAVNLEFIQTQVADEFGIFQSVVNIIDRDKDLIAEWPPARLHVWLEKR